MRSSGGKRSSSGCARWCTGDEPPFVAFVEGDAGVGKTALLEAVVGRRAGARVLRARPTAAEAASSYAALDDLLRPVIDGLRGCPRRSAARWLLRCCSRTPATRSTRAWSRSPAGRCSAGCRVRSCSRSTTGSGSTPRRRRSCRSCCGASSAASASVVATVRSGEADEAARGAGPQPRPTGHALELPLAPLDRGARRELVHARTGEWLPPPPLARLHDACGGNPLLALELVRAPGTAPATDVRRLLARRLAALPPDARALLRVVAALAEPTVEAVEAEAPWARAGARRRRARPRRHRGCASAHPLIAAVVEERTPPAEWRALHARLAEDGAYARAARAASRRRGRTGPDEHVAAALEAAAAEAEARGATIAAAELAERAAELTPDTDVGRRVDRLLLAADAAIERGDGPRARPLLEEVLERTARRPAARRGAPQARLSRRPTPAR